MSQPEKLIIAIHDLHPWGGQDKSNLEILYHLNSQIPIDVHSFTFVDSRSWPQLNHIKYSSPLNRPAFIKSIFYSLISFFKLRKIGSRHFRKKNKIIIQSTGTASSVADVIQVQFIHTTWLNILKEFNVSETENPFKALYHAFLGGYNTLCESLFYTNNKKYIAISHSIKKELIEHFSIDEKNISTIYHGVDTNHFFHYRQSEASTETRQNVRRELGLTNDDLALLHVGALNQRKGLFNSIRTLAHLKKNGITNVYLLAIGAGDKNEIMQFAKRENVDDQIKIISHSKNVRDYYWASDVFFFPSIYEPFGLVILEAMACGLPCLVSGNAGASELITHKENGLIIQNIFDPQSMASELLQILKDASVRDRLGLAAQNTALSQHWTKVSAEYADFYKNYFN